MPACVQAILDASGGPICVPLYEGGKQSLAIAEPAVQGFLRCRGPFGDGRHRQLVGAGFDELAQGRIEDPLPSCLLGTRDRASAAPELRSFDWFSGGHGT